MTPPLPVLRLLLLVLAFVAGGTVMVFELAAPRLVAPDLGTTALTWTVVIATFLGGLALGNAWGGRLADRGRGGLLPLLFAAAGALGAAAIPLHVWAADLLGEATHGVRTLLAVPLAFAPAAFVLGTLPPMLGRTLLHADPRPGRALGALSGAGALGSVAGTLLTGFFLVPHHGTRLIFVATAFTLVLAGVLARFVSRRPSRHLPGEARPRRPHTLPRAWCILAVLAGAALLAVEILAGRVATWRLGSSVYTWTSVIGVVLAGLAVGAVLGGRLADRYAPRPLLAVLLLAASLAVAFTIWGGALMERVGDLRFPWGGRQSLPWPLAALVAVAAVYFVPAITLGSLSPVVIRAALKDPDRDGRVVGGLYSAGTLGAVVSAILVGYVLIPSLGLEGCALLVALALGAAALLVERRVVTFAWLAILVALGVLLGAKEGPLRQAAAWARVRTEDPTRLHEEDSRYYRIRVHSFDHRWIRLTESPDYEEIARRQPLFKERVSFDEGRNHLCWEGPMSIVEKAHLGLVVDSTIDRRAVERLRRLTHHDQRLLELDRLIHGYVDLDEPHWLGYDYEQIYAGLVRRLRPGGEDLRCLFIGGGAFAFQRYLLASEGEGASIVTAEIDPAVTRVAHDHLGLMADPRHRIVNEDARTFVRRLPEAEGGFHFVFGDAFNDLAVPFHLTTREFTQLVHERMAPDGVYLVNVIDIYDSGRFVGAFLCTLEAVFTHVAILSYVPRWDGSRETFVIAATDGDLDLRHLDDDRGLTLPVVRYDEEELETLRGRAQHRVLVDDHAPVEVLLAPVVEDRGG